ncbi:hypothetical protein A3D05_05520 [Candidatus Gottesmanbacteria bacterium RIFCSPHIGHO2_02_FULL_40_24]|nr:MAG: hypothetical protein A3D05_05520 [Candidatus Gottesmanbacteria bacterium RIFCSPHIGHO2_02_FULL_40_24]
MTPKEKKSLTERAAEISKKIDKTGIVAGLAGAAYGVVRTVPGLVSGGILLAGTSAVTLVIGEKIRRSAERKRKAKQSKTVYRYKAG